jgi:hypothetical protein
MGNFDLYVVSALIIIWCCRFIKLIFLSSSIHKNCLEQEEAINFIPICVILVKFVFGSVGILGSHCLVTEHINLIRNIFLD